MNTGKFDVALSFAGEDRAAAEALAGALIERGVTVFYDRYEQASLWGGDLYEHLLDVYQNQARYCVMFLSAHYARSAWTNQERRAAQARAFREKEAYILPIRLDATEIPGILPTVAWVDWATETPRSIATMIAKKVGHDVGDEDGRPVVRLINVPRLPPHLLHRTAAVERIRESLLRGRGDRVGLHGMGGIGKSVLAAAVAHDAEVARAFHDGVVWLTIGRDPRIEARLADLCYAIEGTRVELPDVAAWTVRIDSLLRGRRILIILDDLWTAEHAEAFGRLGGDSCMLVTTRDSRVLTTLGAEAHAIEALSEDDAIDLLALASGQPRDTLPVEAAMTARECGHLPLALSVVGAMGRGVTGFWPLILQRLASADLRALRFRFPTYPYVELMRALQVSVEDLGADVAERFRDLVVFRHAATIPAAAIFRMWGDSIDDLEKKLLLRELADKSLIRAISEETYRLHDLYVDYLRADVADQPERHARLVDGYARLTGQDRVAGPNDGYYFENLIAHLSAAGRNGEAYALLTGSQRWIDAKRKHGGWEASLLADIDVLLDGMADPLPPSDVPQFFGLCMLRLVLQVDAERLRDEDLHLMAVLGRSTEALGMARLRRHRTGRLSGLVAIARGLRERGSPDPMLLDEIVMGAEPLSDVYEGVLMEVARELDASGDVRCRAIVEHVHGRLQRKIAESGFVWEKFRTAGILAMLLADHRDERAPEALRDAVERFARVRSHDHVQFVEQLNARLIDAGLLHEAVKLVGSSDGTDLVSAIASKLTLARALDARGESAAAAKLRDRVQDDVRWISGGSEVPLGMAKGLAGSDDEEADRWFRKAIDAADAVDRDDEAAGPETHRARALQHVAAVMVGAGRVEWAMDVIRMYPLWIDSRGHYAVAEALALRGDPRAAALFDEILTVSSVLSYLGEETVVPRLVIAGLVSGDFAAMALSSMEGADRTALASLAAVARARELDWVRDRQLIDAAGWSRPIDSNVRRASEQITFGYESLVRSFRPIEFDHLGKAIAALTDLVPSLESVQRGISFAAIRECVRIAGWVQWRWRNAHKLLSTP